MFDRNELIQKTESIKCWDIIIIGGGATGLGIAVDAASRGYKILLLEAFDFAKGTSSRSTKLSHGGVRYLEQGNIQLVYSALRERGYMLKNAPHLVKKQSFIIPCYSLWQRVKFITGLKLYDWLSSKLSFGTSRALSKKEVVNLLPGISEKGLRGGVLYFDGQFDDARLAINLARTAIDLGAVALNYFEVKELLKDENGKLSGVIANDKEATVDYKFYGRVVINATGVFADKVLKMDNSSNTPVIATSQGIHLVFNRSFMDGDNALMIPKTPDGRVLFAVPWHNHIIVGTTDTPVNENAFEPKAKKEEIEFIINTLTSYLRKPPQVKDIQSIFTGLRPLVKDPKIKTTKDLSRDHKLMITDSCLITIIGGKWTTYRKMAEDAVDNAILIGHLQKYTCITKDLLIHGANKNTGNNDVYGSDRDAINKLVVENPSLGKKLHSQFQDTEAEVVFAVREEMARTIEDILSRRLRILFLDAMAALAVAPRVAEIISQELGYSPEWEQNQIKEFTQLAENYLPYSIFKDIN
jgi:glycerol-3-phosphate dehydrogenase